MATRQSNLLSSLPATSPRHLVLWAAVTHKLSSHQNWFVEGNGHLLLNGAHCYAIVQCEDGDARRAVP